MSENTGNVTQQRLQELLMFLGSPTKGQRIKGLNEIMKIIVFPDLISEPDQFLKDIVMTICGHLNDESEVVREKCAFAVKHLVEQLGKKSLDLTLQVVCPNIFVRILSEKTEEPVIALLDLLYYFVSLVGMDTYPSVWDDYSENTFKVLIFTFKSMNPKVLSLSCNILLEMSKKSAGYKLKELAPDVIKSVIPLLKHKHNEIRKLALESLAEIYILTGTEEHTRDLATLLEVMTYDRILSVRLAVVDFVRNLLVRHEARHMLYYPFITILLASIYPITPIRPIEEYEEIKPLETTEQAENAFKALTEIGRQHEEDKENDYREELQYKDPRKFDDEREIGIGLYHILQDNFVRLMDRLLQNLSNWKVPVRNFGYHAISPLLHIVGEYSTRYHNQLFTQLSISIRDIRGDVELAMRCAATLSHNLTGDDIVVYFVPKLTNEGPLEVVMLLQVALVNTKFNDGCLSAIMTAINDNQVWESLQSINHLAQAVLAMIEKSTEFREINSQTILTTILRICEKGDALHYFEKCFGRSISIVFAEQMSSLLTVTNKSPKFLSQLLLTTPPEAVSRTINLVCRAICESLADPTPDDITDVMKLIITLCERNAVPDIDSDLLDAILEHADWRAGKEFFTPREQSVLALAKLIQCNAITSERCDEDFEKIIKRCLSSIDDSWSDIVRVASISFNTEFMLKCSKLDTKFDDIYKTLRERLDDGLVVVRVGAVKLFTIFLKKCVNVEAVKSKWEDLLLFIDDEIKELREAIVQMVNELSQIETFKNDIREALSEISKGNYHPDATTAANELIEKLK